MIVIPVASKRLRLSVLGAPAALAFALLGCGSKDESPQGVATGGASVATGGTASGGAPAGATTGGTLTGGSTGVGGSTGGSTGGTPTGGTAQGGSSGGTPSGGTGTGGDASGGISGAAGTSGAGGADLGGAGSGGDGGLGGAAGGGTAGAGGGGAGGGGAGGGGGSGGMMDCKGNALDLSSNVAGGADPAKSRVMVDFMQSTDLPLGNANRTIEFWAYTLTSSWVGENNTIFEYGDQSTQNAGFGLDFGGNNATMDPYTNGSCDNDNQASGVMEDDQWVHFAMTYDGSAVHLYVNGTDHSNKSCAMLATARTQLSIGGNPRGSYFNGKLDEFRVWNVARSAGDIMATMNVTLAGDEAGLVAYYNFNETSGTTAADSVTSAGHTAHDGTLMATMQNQVPTFVPSDAPIDCP